MKKRNITIITIILLISVLVVLLSASFIKEKKEKADNRIIYNFVYYDDGEPGSKKEVNVKKDTVEVITTNFCSAIDCKEREPQKKEYKYSDENIEKVKKFLSENFNFTDDVTLELHESELEEKEREIMIGLLLGQYFFETAVEEYKYQLDYSKSESLNYVVYFKEDKSILVKKLTINDEYDITEVKTYSISFSKEGMNTLYSYIEKEANGKDGIVYKNSTLRKDEEPIINSIVENDEEYLKDISSKPNVAYIISYTGMNCLTPTLYLYNDNTYEYYYTFAAGDKKLTPKTGTYDFDVQEIIDSIIEKESNIGFYTIKNNMDESYKIATNNEKINELLGSINVSLMKCLEQE